MKLRKNDMVAVMSGKDRGKKGKILQVLSEKTRVLIEGINYRKVHKRPTRDNPKGGIVQMETPLAISNVMLVCPRCGKTARVGHTLLADGTKQRICKKCKEILEK
ncbi:MAG: 50S ribosomal protein L24 [Candidatus Omnitrophica bacterium]|nr:50S ribosomal protein L24 [Candidatus Omnitrophota bacterium]